MRLRIATVLGETVIATPLRSAGQVSAVAQRAPALSADRACDEAISVRLGLRLLRKKRSQ